MKLPGLHLFEKKEKPQYFLAFILRDEKAIAIVFKELAGEATIVGKGESVFTKSIEEIEEEELLDACDKAISKAEESLPPGEESKKTIFGLKDEWIEENKIKKQYLDKLKKVSDELGLTPIGFLQTSEAILNLLKSEEGAPLTAILVEFSNKFIIVSVVKAGKVIESKGADVVDNETITVENILKHFSVEILPSRILLYGKNAEKYLQQFLAHQWSKSLSFLHVPQSVALPDDLDVQGVLYGAASQLGFTVMADFVKKDVREELPETDKQIEKVVKKEIQEEEKMEKEVGEIGEETKDINEETEEISPTTIISDSKEAFGFLEEADIASVKGLEEKVKEDEEAEELEEEEIIKEEEKEPEKIKHALEIEETKEEEEAPRTNRRRKLPLFNLLSKSRSFLFPIFAFSKKGGSFLNFVKGRKIVALPILAIVFIAILYGVYVFTLKANIVLTIDPESKEQKETVTFAVDGTTDADKNQIAARIESITEEGSTETKATGKKETGTPAKGSVTVCSRFTEDKTLPSGTVITSNNNLSFTTETSAKVASASADASADCTKATISVTAKGLGKEYNLPAGTKFTVGNFSSSDIIAKNDDPFSGGTKKEITVISKEDLAKAESNLIKELEDKALEDLRAKISKDDVLLPELINKEVQDSTLNKKVGEEASSLKINGSVSYDGVVYSKADLLEFTKGLFDSQLTGNQIINEKGIDVRVDNIKNKNEELVADVNFKVNFLPKIENNQLVTKVGGMGIDQAREYLSKLPQIEDVKINLSINLPFLPKFLPRSSSNILIETKQ